MSKIGNLRVEIQESDSYQLGWILAELGIEVAPYIALKPGFNPEWVQRGWQAYHDQERSR